MKRRPHMQTVCGSRWVPLHRLTAYPACKPEAVLAGAEFVDADDNIPETVVVDGNLVRARKRHAPRVRGSGSQTFPRL